MKIYLIESNGNEGNLFVYGEQDIDAQEEENIKKSLEFYIRQVCNTIDVNEWTTHVERFDDYVNITKSPKNSIIKQDMFVAQLQIVEWFYNVVVKSKREENGVEDVILDSVPQNLDLTRNFPNLVLGNVVPVHIYV